MRNKSSFRFVVIFVLIAMLAVFPLSVGADHAWGNYHWARTANPFTLKVGDNVNSTWDQHLDTTISDWSQSQVLNLTKVTGGTKPRNCRPTSGRVEVCNATYGNTGWLGVAQIWITGGVHITQGIVKNNDTYFNTPTYNTSAWRNLVMCQEVGHTLGLDHQDENFNNANLGTCMDYTNNPGTNQHPNQHDYDQLVTIYSHLDSTTTIGATPAGFANADVHAIENWGEKVSDNGKTALFVRDFGKGFQIFTFVIWAE
ncbi:MAG TPA: hypothetical protein VFR47_01140 [Anaerolineales bacterium]|nr:hypothetical protein [Anaerolineales bacterium]